MLILSLLTYNG